MNLRRIRRRGERGVSVVIVGITFTGVFAMGALAVDLGAGYTERRHDQNTVDAAVMSGLVRGALAGGVINDIVAEVRVKVDTTLGTTVSTSDWSNCTDPGQLEYTTVELQTANPTISPVTECISFSRGFNELRVRLPDQDVPIIFGGVIGAAGFDVHAVAHGKIQDAGVGGPPFIALSTATQGDFICLRTSSPGEPLPLMDGNGPKVAPSPGLRADPCDSASFAASTSSFGTLLPWRYESGPSWAACSRQGNQTVTQAIQIGIDHILGVFPNGYDPNTTPASEIREDGANNCKTAFPNTMELDTGFAAGELRCALISNKNSTDCDGIPARFHQGPNYTPNSGQRFLNEDMDNVAPWTYLRSAQSLYDEGYPPGCVAVAASRSTDNFDLHAVSGQPGYAAYTNVVDADWDHYDRYDDFVDCITLWGELKHTNPPCDVATPPASCYWPDGVIFLKTMGDSARFAFVPQVWESVLNSQTHWVHIEGFLPTFMYRMYTKRVGTMCDPLDGRPTTFMIHDAGQILPGQDCGHPNGKVDRLASLILACGMLTRDLCDKETGMPKSSGIDIYDFHLVK